MQSDCTTQFATAQIRYKSGTILELPILKRYEGMLWVLGGVNPEYFTVLQKVGKQDEIEKATDERTRSNRVYRGPS